MYDKFIKNLKDCGTYATLKSSTPADDLQGLLFIFYSVYNMGYIQGANDINSSTSKNDNLFIKN